MPLKLHSVTIGIYQIRKDSELPKYQTDFAAGMDLRASIPIPVTILPGERASIPVGISVFIPDGYEGQVRSRSGLAIKHGVVVLNSPGTIDADFRGEIRVILVNHGKIPFTVNDLDRIAQFVIAPVARAEWRLLHSLDATKRGENGFGSTGTS
jgi:dUTP pyrophosphatase